MSRLGHIARRGWLAGFVFLAGPLIAQESHFEPVNSYGVPGMIDMPNAYMQPDGEITTNIAYLPYALRLTGTFQVLPRLQGVFRYSYVENLDGPTTSRYDRSFDLRYQLLTESTWRPALTIGLQDFGGTGVYSGEYLVASKTFQDRLTLTGGIGWGRLGSYEGFSNPFGLDVRPGFQGLGGEFSTDQWFRGPAAFFGGLSYQYSEKLRFNVEYSSDNYTLEQGRRLIDHKSPVNVGFTYAFRPGAHISGYTIAGDTVGLNLTFTINPKRAVIGPSGADPAPLQVQGRPDPGVSPALWNTAWAANPASAPQLETGIKTLFADVGLQLESYHLEATEAEVRFRNPSYRSMAQAIGRAARALSYALPASVEHFVLVPLEAETGLPGAAVRIARSDLEDLEETFEAAETLYARAEITDAAARDRADLTRASDLYPAWEWAFGPYTSTALFDPGAPLRLDIGVELSARYEPMPGLVFSGSARRKILGNQDGLPASGSALPAVRTTAVQYLRRQNDAAVLNQLMGEYFFRPAETLYGRLSAGYFETMFGGLSAELLWRPQNSRLALGAEINRVRQREVEQGFGFQAYEVTTGHVSAYYSHRNNFYSQLDIGQYLAGDRGATYTLMREFENGWRVGGYFTRTNVSAAQFGEGSFDKGIRVTIPLDWVLGRSVRQERRLLIQPIQRDGGARLKGPTRLYDVTRPLVEPTLGQDWARVWR